MGVSTRLVTDSFARAPIHELRTHKEKLKYSSAWICKVFKTEIRNVRGFVADGDYIPMG